MLWTKKKVEWQSFKASHLTNVFFTVLVKLLVMVWGRDSRTGSKTLRLGKTKHLLKQCETDIVKKKETAWNEFNMSSTFECRSWLDFIKWKYKPRKHNLPVCYVAFHVCVLFLTYHLGIHYQSVTPYQHNVLNNTCRLYLKKASITKEKRTLPYEAFCLLSHCTVEERKKRKNGVRIAPRCVLKRKKYWEVYLAIA